MVIEITLADVSVEHGFIPKTLLPGETRDLAIHFPPFEAVAELAAQWNLKKTLECRSMAPACGGIFETLGRAQYAFPEYIHDITKELSSSPA